MKNSMNRALVVAILFVAFFALGETKETRAGLQVNIDIAIPPPLQFAGPPDVYVVPSGKSYVYMVPDYDGVYFYGGDWYRFYNDHWFRTSHYSARWNYIETYNVPQVIIVVPPEYIHYVPSGYYRIHYDDYHSNWRTWDKRRHWDSYDWYQHERRDDTRRERHEHIENDRHHRDELTSQHQQVQHEVQQPRQQQNVQPREHQPKQGQQQQIIQEPQHQQKQEQQQHTARKPEKQNSQKQQKHDGGQKPQQQGDKEHGSNK